MSPFKTLKRSDAVTKAGQADPHAVGAGKVKVGQATFRVGFVFEDPARFDIAVATAAKDERQLATVVAVSIHHVRAEEKHGVVEQGAVALVDALHFLQNVGELLHVPLVDLLVFGESLGIIGVVGDAVHSGT